MRDISLRLDVVPGMSPKIIWLSQDDSAFTIEAELFARTGTLEIENGTAAEIRGTRADGSEYSKSASLAGNIVTIRGDKAMTHIPGAGKFEITLTRNGKFLSSSNFFINVEPAPLHVDEG